MMATKILVVDDDEEIRTLLRRGLALEGYAVTTASDGEEALEHARQAWPDLVVLDVLMPSSTASKCAAAYAQPTPICRS